jgi:4-hydroxy 2-oxovalerate aldolase
MHNDILLFDATIRDGSHANKHQIGTDVIAEYCEKIDSAGLHCVIVGHGNGLGASSLQVGLSKHTDHEMLTAARANLIKTKLGTYMIPGFGTIKDDLIPAIEVGVDVFKIGCHCTEADTTKEHIEYLVKNGKETYGVLMMSHMITPDGLLEQVKKMASYGVTGVTMMDSAGAMLPDEVKKRIDILCRALDIRIGFHAHNNLSMAVANTLAALEVGASIIDGTLKGFGAGAGNCQLEVITAILQKYGKLPDVNLYALIDVCDDIVEKKLHYSQGVSSLSLISGMSGVFSAFSEHVKRAAIRFNVDPRDIFVELGRRKVVGGQEDMVVDVAMNLSQKNKEDETSYLLESLL